MDISTKYRLLTRMPLLQGLSGQDLARLEDSHGLEMEVIPPSRVPLLNQGDACTHLILVASGKVLRRQTTPDGKLTLSACMMPPVAIEPENLYGLQCHFHSSYYAESEPQIISIRKNDVDKILMSAPIFRYNLLNYLSAITHKQTMLMMPSPPRSVSQKFLHLLETVCREDDSRPTGHQHLTLLHQHPFSAHAAGAHRQPQYCAGVRAGKPLHARTHIIYKV